MTMLVTPEELLAGHDLTFDVTLPPDILQPSLDDAPAPNGEPRRIRLRPLTIHDVQLIGKAAKDDEILTSLLMIQQAVVEPKLTQAQVARMHSGLVSFLVRCINRISGLTTAEDDLRAIAESPLVRAFYILAREFNWTPQQVQAMTVGQILGYLELLNETRQQL